VLLAVAAWLPPGLIAGLAALPWLMVTVLLAGTGVLRAARDGLARPLDRLCADAAMVLLAIGGVWTVLDRLVYQPFGFERGSITLTAVHFHYLGLLLPIYAGFIQRQMPESRVAARAAVGVVIGALAVAVGIAATQLGAGPVIEAAAGSALAMAGAVVAVLHVRLAIEPGVVPSVRALLGVTGATLFFSMAVAALYAIRGIVTPIPPQEYPELRAMQGIALALGFGLCGAFGWRRFLLTASDE
jgi:hypothetical protein